MKKQYKKTDHLIHKKKPIIELKDAWKIYEMGDVKVNALRGLNLRIFPGEFVSIEGPSGSGKSTAMNLVGCLDYPTKGNIYLEGKDIVKLGESELAQIRGRKIGFVFQQFNLINTLSALENVMLPMVFQGRSRKEREDRAKKLLQMVENGTVFKREKSIKWKCGVCGYVHEGTEPPVKCPCCKHPREYYEPANMDI